MRLSCPGSALWSLVLLFVQSTLLAECEPRPAAFEVWPDDEPVPVRSIPDDQWFRSPLGWVVAPDRCQAAEAAAERQAAFEAFERQFGRTAIPGAIVDVRYAETFAALRDAGAGWVLPWRFASQAGSVSSPDPREAPIRRQVEAQLSSGGRSPDPQQVDVLVERALAQLAPAASSGSPADDALEPRAIRHEVAHMLFLHGVWPSTRSDSAQYGGDAPDWLDEAAAVAAESSGMTKARRAAFRDAARTGRLLPLEHYLTMTHPVFGSEDLGELMREARAQAARDGAAVISASVGEERIAEARIFYAQTRGWLDFLHGRTGDARILGQMADALRAGQSFNQWLALSAADVGLPDSLPALQDAFQSWALNPVSVEPLAGD